MVFLPLFSRFILEQTWVMMNQTRNGVAVFFSLLNADHGRRRHASAQDINVADGLQEIDARVAAL